MSTGLALFAATLLSAAIPTSTAAPVLAPPVSAHAQAVQYVQVQYRNVLKNSSFQNMGSQMLGNVVKAQFNSFISSVMQTALSHLNPVLGFIANRIANRIMAKVTTVSINTRTKPNVAVVAEFEATTTISPSRTRTDIADISTIVQCDKQQIIVMDNTAKVYSTRSLTDTLNDAESSSGFGPFGGGAPDPTQQIAVPQPDDGTETIAGLVAHHQLITSPQNGFGTGKTDLWFADVPMPNACSSMPQQPGIANVPQTAASASAVRIPLRSLQWSEMDFSAPTPAPSPSPNASASPIPYQDPLLGTPGIAWVETTSVRFLPYDSSYFDIPSGYTLATPEPSAPPL